MYYCTYETYVHISVARIIISTYIPPCHVNFASKISQGKRHTVGHACYVYPQFLSIQPQYLSLWHKSHINSANN